MYDCIIIGAGPCGVACAIYLKQAGYNVLVIENELVGGQPLQTTNISNLVGFKGTGEQFGEILSSQLEDNNIDLLYGYANIENNEVYVNDEKLETKTILIATGAKPNCLPIIPNAHYCALCDGILYKDKTVIVVGSGNSAYEETSQLSKIAKKVYLLQSSQFPILANKDLINQVGKLTNVEILNYNELLSNIEQILTFSTKEGQTKIRYDGIFVCIGRRPNIQCLKDFKELKVDSNYNVLKNELPIKNIFAGGDVLNKPIKQISTAINDGVMISQNIIKYLKGNN